VEAGKIVEVLDRQGSQRRQAAATGDANAGVYGIAHKVLPVLLRAP